MDDEKPVLEQMTDMMAGAAHVTKEAAKKAVRKVKKVAKKVMPKKSAKKKAVKKSTKKEEVETLDRFAVLQPCALHRMPSWGGICCGMRRSSPRVYVDGVRPSSARQPCNQSDL